MRIIKCQRCGKEFQTRANNRKYCDKCVRETDRINSWTIKKRKGVD